MDILSTRRLDPRLLLAELPPLGRASRLVAELAAGHETFEERERLMRRIVRRAQTGPDADVALLVLVAAQLPALLTIRRRLPSDDPDERDALIVATFCESVASYPLDRRVGPVGVGLRWDVEHRVARRLRRVGRRAESMLCGSLAELQSVGADEGWRRWTLEDIAQRASLEPTDLRLLERHRLEGVSLGVIAAEHVAVDAGPDRIAREVARLRKRESRALRRLRTVAAHVSATGGEP